MVDIPGSLKSPLPDYELIMKSIRQLWESCQSHSTLKQALAKHDFPKILGSFQEEIDTIEEVGKKLRVKIIRLEDTLNSAETTLKQYKKTLKKTIKKQKDESAKSQLDAVESLLKQIRTIKKNVRDEARRAASEEGKIAGHI
jgi:virulence-associated protein VapD